jgi:type IV secretion system protein VirB11
VCEALDDPSVVEVQVNEDGAIWVDRLVSGKEELGEKMEAAYLLDALGTLAALLGKEINRDDPTLLGELPIDNGSRVTGIVPPVTSSPTMVIRKRVSSLFSLSDYVREGRLSERQRNVIAEALRARKNIVLSGGTGSGKTTFGNALLLEMKELSPNERVVTMEDTIELQCGQKNKTSLKTVKDLVTLNDLVRLSMRLSPERLIVGEVRGKEALELLKSWNTGHPGGFATLHANSASAALLRLEQLILEATPNPMRELVAEAVDMVVHLQRHAVTGPRVEQIIEVRGVKNGEYDWNEI